LETSAAFTFSKQEGSDRFLPKTVPICLTGKRDITKKAMDQQKAAVFNAVLSLDKTSLNSLDLTTFHN
jgi:hypothetical protein